MKHIRAQKGFTLIEVLISLAVILTIAVASFFLFNNVDQKNKLNKEVDHLNMIKSSLDSINKFDGVSLNGELFKSLEISDDPDGKIFDTWKSPISIKKAGKNDMFYNIEYSNMQRYNCVNLAQNLKKSFPEITINNTVLTKSNISDISTTCQDVGNNISFSNFSTLEDEEGKGVENGSGNNNGSSGTGSENQGGNGSGSEDSGQENESEDNGNNNNGSDNSTGKGETGNSGSNTDTGIEDGKGNSVGEETQNPTVPTMTPEEYKKKQKELLDNSPWDQKIIDKTVILPSGAVQVSFKDGSAGSIDIDDADFASILGNVLKSNHGTVSTSDVQNYISSFGDTYSDRIDGKSVTFTNSPVPKNLCTYSRGFSCDITQNSNGEYTTKVTFSKAEKFAPWN